MPQLPNTDGQRPTPSANRSTQDYTTSYSRDANNAMARSADIMADTLQDFSNDYERDKIDEGKRKAIEAKSRREALLRGELLKAQDYENKAHQQVQDLLWGTDEVEGLYAAKGENALDLEKQYTERFKTIREASIEGVQNPDARRALEKSLDQMYQTNLSGIKRHRNAEQKAYSAALSNTRANVSIQSAGLYYNDNDVFKLSLQEVEKAARNEAMAMGLPEETITQHVKDAGSKVYEARLVSMLKSSDPKMHQRAALLYDAARTRGKLTYGTVNKLDGIMDQLLPQIEADKVFNDMIGATDFESMDIGDIFERGSIQVESGGRQFDDQGNPIKSNAGAVGIAQIMEATGPEAARDAGVEWDAERWRTDEAYNKKLGDAYLGKLKKQFQSNTLALLAYNWGMGNVNKHIKKVGDPRKGDISYDEFLARIDNDEARNYVPKIQKALGVDPMGLSKIDRNEAIIKAATMSDPRARKIFEKKVEINNEYVEATEKQFVKDTLNEAMDRLETDAAAGTYLTVFDAEMYQKAAQAGFLDDLESYRGYTDPYVAEYLYSLSAEDLKDIDLNTPQYRLKLSLQDYQDWTKKQEALNDPSYLVAADQRNKLINNAFLDLGMSSSTDEGKKRKNNVNRLLDVYIDRFAKENGGRYPNAPEMEELIDRIFMEKDVTPDWWAMGGKTPLVDIDIEDIPKDDYQKIIDILARKNIPITEGIIIDTYIRSIPSEAYPMKGQ